MNEINDLQPPDLLPMPVWTPGDGPTPYVWNSLPRGHRCAWACHWLVAGEDYPIGKGVLKTTKMITPLQWAGGAIDAMTPAQICAELQDHLDVNGFHALAAYHTIKAFEDGIQAVIFKADKLLRQIRETYKEYEYPGPGRPDPEVWRVSGLRANPRPGWAEFFEKVRTE